MKKHVLKTGFAALAAISLLSSCASNFSLTKRRYSSGYQVQLSLFGKEKQKTEPQTAEQSNIQTERLSNLNAQTPKALKFDRIPQTAKPLNLSIPVVQKHTEVQSLKDARRVNLIQPAKHNQIAQAIKPATSEKRMLKRNLARNIEDSTLLYLIIAFFIPCLGVLLYEGEITSHFWISLLLMVLFWLPGIIYAFLVILGEI